MNGLIPKKECLVIGPYGKDNSEERAWSDWLLQNIVKRVVEDDEFGYEANRTIDASQPGAIPKHIMRSLRTADLVVADLTWSNPNVYYELALRHASGKPFIHLARKGTQIPFDIEVMNVIEVAQNDEARAREQLRGQVKSVKSGNVIFLTDACEPQPRLQAQAYDWEITYSSDLADDWLKQQDHAVQQAVNDFNSHGGLPSEFLKHSLLEYLSYRLAHGAIVNVELYYVIDTKDGSFEGWGVAPSMAGRGPLAISVKGFEEKNKGCIELWFDQPQAHQKIGGLEGDIGPFQYPVRLKSGERRAGVFEGQFFHPQCKKGAVLVGTCILRPRTG